MQKLFISHSSDDADIVQRIVSFLEANGTPCWVSSRDIPAKAIYAQAIADAMRDASACAVLISKAANKSAAVLRELELASRYNKPFIPVRIDASEPASGLDYYLNNTQWVDYARDGESALNRITANPGSGGFAMVGGGRRRARTPPAIWVTLAVVLVAAGGLLGWRFWPRPPSAIASNSSGQSAATPIATSPPAPTATPASSVATGASAPSAATQPKIEAPPPQLSPISSIEFSDALRNLDDRRVAKYLKAGWDPNAFMDSESNAALHALMGVCEKNPTHDQQRLAQVARVLIKAGADPRAKNKWGDTPLTIAMSPKYCGPDHPVVAVLQGG